MARPLLETGIEIIEGVPGSGKSYYLVRRMLDLVSQTRRPVYTNLPLKWDVCRHYLRQRGGEKLANLIYELKEEHFTRFCQRQTARAKHNELHSSFRSDLKQRERAEAVRQEWYAKSGPDITRGDDANWIPATSIVIIDEVQNWFMQERQKDSAELLVPYVTKHRHHMHLLLVASQDRMQIALPFRRNAAKLWQVRNKGEDQLAWGIRFKHLGWRAIGYAAYSKEQIEAKSLDNVKPLDNYAVITTLPWNSYVFKLYDSFTHLGDSKSLYRELRTARREAGLEAPAEAARSEPERMGIVRKGTYLATRWVLRLILRWTRRAVIFASGVGIAYLVFRGGGERKEVVGGDTTATHSVSEPPAPKWGRWTGQGSDWIRIDRDRIKVDEAVGGVRLLAVDRQPRVALLEHRGLLYAWKWGEAEPRKLGTWDEVGAALHARRVAKLDRSSGQ